jgi:hypothetical protein
MSEAVVGAGLVTFGSPLEPEACSGAIGTLKEKNHQVNKLGMRYVGDEAIRRD